MWESLYIYIQLKNVSEYKISRNKPNQGDKRAKTWELEHTDKKIDDRWNKLKDITCPSTERINIVKMTYYTKQPTYLMWSQLNYLWNFSWN